MQHEVIIALRSVGPGNVAVATSLAKPIVGRKLTHPEAIALDMVNAASHRNNCGQLEWEQALDEDAGLAALHLVRELLTPEGYAYSVSPEVRNAARRVLGIKNREEVPA